MRIQEIHSANESRDPHRCTHRGCGKTTAGGKPFCLAHVTENPYMAHVARRVKERLEEIERVRRLGAAGSPLVAEIQRVLEFSGPLTARRLSTEVGLQPAVVRRLLAAMAAQGLVLLRGGRVRICKPAA